MSNTICPECGTPFTWENALAAYHRGKTNLFEHHWRRRPVRSFVRSFRYALRPARLWREVSLHDQPPVGPLIALAVIATATAMGISIAVHVLSMVILYNVAVPYAFPGQSWAVNTVWGAVRAAAGYPYWMREFATAVTWVVCILASLMLFRQSMRRYRVRNDHIIRAWAYVAPLQLIVFACLWGAMGLAAGPAAIIFNIEIMMDTFNWLFVTPFIVQIVLVTRSMALAYRHYLRMDHAWAVAISAQIIALLATLIVLANITL
ncbi:MAG: hypothetical protein HOP29_12440 [Phycisphaerales bacterium]|nr:hypothetical protein [Phycisphaerales bacterium]